MGLSKIFEPSESEIQEAVVEWASYHPILSEYMICIENERKTTWYAGKKRKKKGVKAGVSDLFLAYSCGGYHGLWLELKVKDRKKGKVSLNQSMWLVKMKAAGFDAHVAWGYDEAIQILKDYLSLNPK